MYVTKWQLLVFGAVLSCSLSNVQPISIADEVAKRNLNCTAILIQKAAEREVSGNHFNTFFCLGR